MKPIGPVLGWVRPEERTTEAENSKNWLNNLRKQIIEAIKIISYYLNTVYSSFHFHSH